MRIDDIWGRVIGTVVFLVGIGLLVFTFITAYGLFNSAAGALPTGPVSGSTEPATAQVGQSALRLLIRIALLIVMTIVGSLLAGRGAQLYFAAKNVPQPAIRPNDE